MKTLAAKLAGHFEAHGWDQVRHVTDLEWWADEIWELTSRWSPVGTPAFITFLVDPMWEGNRRKGQAVWAIGCNAHYPADRVAAGDGGRLTLNASKAEIAAFVDAVNSFRNARGKSRA